MNILLHGTNHHLLATDAPYGFFSPPLQNEECLFALLKAPQLLSKGLQIWRHLRLYLQLHLHARWIARMHPSAICEPLSMVMIWHD